MGQNKRKIIKRAPIGLPSSWERKDKRQNKGRNDHRKNERWGQETGIGIKKEEEIMTSKIKGKDKKQGYLIISVYNSRNWDRIQEVIKEQ